MQLAQNIKFPGMTGTLQGPIPASKNFVSLSSLVTNAFPILFSLAGLLLFGYLIWGGFDYLLAIGDPKKAETGKTKITNALIGFVIIFAAFWITQIVDYMFNLGIYTPRRIP